MDKVNAKDYLEKEVEIKIDRPLGTRHPKHGFMYMINYGFIPNTVSGDGEELDAYLLGEYEPGKEPIVFTGGGTGKIAKKARGNVGRWHDKFYIPDGETETLSELREKDRDYEAKFWGTAKYDFAEWFKNNKM